jgi:protein phosphatase
MNLIYASATERGTIRRENEDALLAHGKSRVFAVSDGMGGLSGGAVASSLAVDIIRALLERSNGDAPSLFDLFAAANGAVRSEIENGRGGEKMGATLALLRFAGDRYETGHVGDSRIYLYREGALLPLTTDHSLAQELLDRGEIAVREARRHPGRNLLTRFLGLEAEPSVETGEGRFTAGDIFLLLTDGVTRYFDDPALREECRRHAAEPARLASALVNGAVQAGGEDNATGVIVRVATEGSA